MVDLSRNTSSQRAARLACWLLLVALATPCLAQSETATDEFLRAYCIDCHGTDDGQADRDFSNLSVTLDDASDSNDLATLQDILDQLNLGQMPPPEADQPSDDQRRAMTKYLTEQIARYHSNRANSQTSVLRRRNNREYRNAICDLLQLNTLMFDPTVGFPRDNEIDHFDNIAGSLTTSGFLLDRYLDAADVAVEKTLTLTQRPKVQHWHFTEDFHQQKEIDQVHKTTTQFDWLTLYDCIGADKHEGGYAPIHAFGQGVPHDGYYDIEYLAEAVNRDHPYDDAFLNRDRNEPLRLGIRPGRAEVGPLHKPQPIEPLLAATDLADEQRWYRSRVWLDAGYTPRFTFCNGLMDVRNLWTRLIRKYPDEFPKNLKGIVAMRKNAIKLGKLPQIHIHEVKISGPFYHDQHEEPQSTWPLAQHVALLGDGCERILASGQFPNSASAIARLQQFAGRAFRRDLSEPEIAELSELYAARIALGRNQLEAYGDVAKSVLVSPSFLFLAPEGPRKQADSLAATLWASVPDAELLKACRQGLTEQLLRDQVDRMLNDAKSARFVSAFLNAWLNLRDLGAAPPDRSQFRDYYHFELETAMREETQRYFRHLIEHDLPPELLLDSDFSFLNKRLAAHYDVPFEGPNKFRKVTLASSRRGGLLGQASVLTVSANGVETSPVVRGIWVLESLLNSPPSPPPPDVPPLDPDTRGAGSIRDRLAKHRSTPACNDCHRKIDPPGFALENFDPVGRWREKYDKMHPVDASGILGGDRHFSGIEEFKKLLLDDRQLFYRALVTKLMTFAHGRLMTAADRPQIDPIVDAIEHDDIGLREVIHRVARTL